jgi:hypothetical protein
MKTRALAFLIILSFCAGCASQTNILYIEAMESEQNASKNQLVLECSLFRIDDEILYGYSCEIIEGEGVWTFGLIQDGIIIVALDKTTEVKYTKKTYYGGHISTISTTDQ